MSENGLCAIVTGSASGLGAATATLLAKNGASIVINYSNSQKEAEATASTCRAAGAAEVIVVQGDVSRDSDCRKIVAVAEAQWGRLDVLVNNAGTTKHMAHHKLDGLSAEEFQQIYAVNTIGPYQMIRAARALLEASAKANMRAASVVNVSSVAGINGLGSSVAYAASKGAVNAMTLSLARALAPSIRVNAVCPGYIDTPWFTKGRGEAGAKQVRDAIVERVPLKIASSANDVAQLIYFLASPASSNMTGECVRVDAGMHLLS
ncbi:SDR family oxidoreductase [Bradyrhizobium sp. 17]|uniref:SDR family NAD(P)-dependent oxidoreductase n=1 Tax=Bradyrhizobium sp. 17 TaxID=2782649 RepID=UPI001FF9FC1F|nr:SDR family oxidoreductase [Bradyrhizobium sp. 17]MCK1520087.1 SDR family oxidoreductase [Bradyrhizobium sp. 17]